MAPVMDEAFLEQVAEIKGAIERLHVLHVGLACTARNRAASSARREDFPLRRALELTADSLEHARHEFPTAESAIPHRLGINQLLELLGLLVFCRFGCDPSGAEADKLFLRKVPLDNAAVEELAVVGGLERLLAASRCWVSGRYQIEPLARAIERLKPQDKAQFQASRATLSTFLNEPFFDLADSKPILDVLRKLRGLAQVAVENTRVIAANCSFEPELGPVLFLFPLSSTTPVVVGGLARTEDAYYLWHSPVWTHIMHDFAVLPKNVEPTVLADRLDDFYETYARHPHVALGDLFGLDRDAVELEPALRLVDLTNRDTPFTWIASHGTRVAISISAGTRVGNACQAPSSVMFWGWSQECGERKSLNVDETNRQIRLLASPHTEWTFPHVSKTPRIARNPAPLPYSHYERWSIQDSCRQAGLPCQTYQDLFATSSALLNECKHASVLHVATHGEIVPEASECSHLMASDALVGTTNVTFMDIMSTDWTHVDLVFLSVCRGSLGTVLAGEGALSLAWAFRAGGARAIIAAQWQVEDHVAWQFSRELYTRWLPNLGKAPLPIVFRQAQLALRNNPATSRPCQWGSFVLIH